MKVKGNSGVGSRNMHFTVLFFQLVFTGETTPTKTSCTVADKDATNCETSIPAS